MDLIRVGIIGYGFAGKTFHAPLIGATPGLALNVIVSRNAAKVHADLPNIEVVADPAAIFASSEVDMVVIASPNHTHLPLARAALAAGKNVVVDKPFTLTLADARELVAAARQSGRLISAFQNRRWDSDYLSIKAGIVAGLVGEVLHFESHFDRYRPQVRQRWRESDACGGGIWFDLGPHLVDQALQLFGLPERVQGNFAKQRVSSLVEDWSHVVLEYRSRRIILHASMLAAGGISRFIVHGLKGTLMKQKSDRQEAQLIAGMKPGEGDWGADPDQVIFFDGSGASLKSAALSGDQRGYYRETAAALRGDAQSPVTPAQILGVMAVIEAAACSARLGCAVPLTLEVNERCAFERDTAIVQA